MKSMKRGLAVLLAALLVLPALPVRAGEGDVQIPTGSGYEESLPDMDISADEGQISEEHESTSESVGNEVSNESEASEAGGESEESQVSEAGEESEESEVPEASEESEESEASEAGGESEESAVPEADDGSEETETPEADGGSGESAVPESGDGNKETEVPETGVGSIESGDKGEGVETGGDIAAGSEAVPGTEAEESAPGVPGSEDADGDLALDTVPEFGNEGVLFNTGGGFQLVVNPSVHSHEEYEGFTGVFDEDGSYTIRIPETDPFFPYEIQFADPELNETQNQWFMTPDSTVEYGGHTFRVSADFTGNAVTQLNLNIAGDIVVMYPEEKDFSGAMPASLLPLEEVRLREVDLNGYTPLELTMVSVESIFAGNAELADTDSIIWTTSYYSGSNSSVPDYTVSQKGDLINLSYAYQVQMIVGEPDQLAADNVRYTASLNKSDYDGWLTPSFYTEDENGTRTEIEVKQDYYSSSYSSIRGSRYEYGYERISLSSIHGNIFEGFLALRVNPENYARTKFTSVKAYEGMYETAAEAMAAAEITNQIFVTDMAQAGSGYRMRRYDNNEITLVSFDAKGNVTGCLPLHIYYSNVEHGLYVDWMRNASGDDITSGRSYTEENGCRYYTQRLYSGNPANGNYVQSFMYYNDGTIDNSVITAAYVGLYSSIAEAAAAGAADVKDTLFRDDSYGSRANGYAGDFSQGISFTVFIGEDGSEGQQVLKYNIKSEERENVSRPNSNTSVSFSGVRDADGEWVSTVTLLDSYAENNYIVLLVNEDVDRSNLALEFYPEDNPKLYAAGSSTPEISGKSYHDFSKGAVQFTASAEDGENAKNYWVQVVTRSTANGQIFMNSLADSSVSTRTENGVIYTSREVMLDYLHDYKHDIMLANMGIEAIDALSAELVSDVVELDDYWTLTGNHELSGFTTTDRNSSYGKLSNLAMLRLRVKEGVEDGTDITGTLTIKSGATALMVMTLTGTVGNPVITTKEIPESVKYVPYGTMIQNSNKYSWNKVTYNLLDGELPEGMVIKTNGELYGVPREVGEFTFTVRMLNSYSDFGESIREFTLVVKENTDENVDSQTDENYNLTDRVTHEYNASLGDQLMVSQGVYGEFVDLWLDGQKLTDGVDYISESGSTRLTIFVQTLSDDKAEGTHTLGVEFRTADTKTLKRAAQNYILGKDTGSDGDEDNSDNNGDGSGSDGNSGNNGGGNDNNGNNSGSTSGASSSSENVTTGTGTVKTSYTVQAGDTLWKIAVKFFGDGNQWRKIYENNKDVISNPDRIYAGQVLKIMDATAEDSQAAAGDVEATGTYAVQPGDSLWKIAVKVYGNGREWRKIYEGNTDRISDASKIHVGQVLIIP